MLPLDFPTAVAICGASSAVAAVLMRPAQAAEAEFVSALRHARQAFAVLGATLLGVLALDALPGLGLPVLLATGAVAGVAMMGWALAALAGRRPPRFSPWLLLLVVAVLMAGVAPLGLRVLNVACGLGLVLASVFIVRQGRRLVFRPRDRNERLVGGALALMLATSLLRAAYLFAWNGPPERHLLYVPPVMVTPFSVLYGAMPGVFAILFLRAVNERLDARLRERAMTDQLTGAMSRHALAEGAEALRGRIRPGAASLAVLMVDLDHFKAVNDHHGHASGDAVLRVAAGILRRQLRADALLVRYGGEEFLALVPVDGLPAARHVAERMRCALEELPWPELVAAPVHVTASLGVTLLGRDEKLEQGIARADEALYRAKAGGRNQVQVALMAA